MSKKIGKKNIGIQERKKFEKQNKEEKRTSRKEEKTQETYQRRGVENNVKIV